MKKPLKSALVAFFGSRTAVGEGSLKAWGSQQRPPVGASTAEALADELVAEGVATVEERSGGRRVWRLVREDAAEEPTTAPEEAAPKEAAPEEAEEEPVAVAGAAEPCQGCADLAPSPAGLLDQEPTAPAPAQHLAIHPPAPEPPVCAWCADLVRERNALRAELGAGLGDALQRTADLAREVTTLRQERDAAKGEVFGLRSRQGDLREQIDVVTLERDEALRECDDLRRRLETPPTVAALDPGAIAHYLLSLPEERWTSLATARQQLAQAREMAHAARALEEAALAAVDGLLSAPAGAPTPAPAPVAELVPPPPAPTPPPVAHTLGEPRPGTMRAEILAWIRQQPDATATVKAAAERFDRLVGDMSSILTTMRNAGLLERVSTGLYRAVKP